MLDIMRGGIVYKAYNKISGKSYIGKTLGDLNKRVFDHLNSSKNNSQSCFHKAIKEYGVQSFIWLIIDFAGTEQILDEKEVYWIKYYNTKIPNGYNTTRGSGGGYSRL